MCDEKPIVISVLRALLISKGKNGPVTLNELKRDYCIQEGKKEIPKFEYKNVGDFLHSSGEFILNVFNGQVMVREKLKSESLHIKKLVMEQKSDKRISRVRLRDNRNHKIVPAHAAKPSVVFKFDEFNNSLNNYTVNGNSSETSLSNPLNEIKTQLDRMATPVDEGKSTTLFSFDDKEAKSLCVSDLLLLSKIKKIQERLCRSLKQTDSDHLE